MKIRILLNLTLFSILLLTNAFCIAITAAKPTKLSAEFQPIRDMLALPEEKIDFAKARLTIEKMIDPSVNIAVNLKLLDQMATQIKKVPRYSDTVEGKLNAIIQYLYHPGKWNNNKPRHYDFDDPLGKLRPETSLLSNYIKTKIGNCISMPILVLILGEKLGMDMKLAKAPNHFFVRLQDNGQFYNFEATSASMMTESAYIKNFKITPLALKNKIYLQTLSKKQMLSTMIAPLAKYYADRSKENSDFDKSFELTSLMLEYDPKDIMAMIIRANTWYHILMRDVKAFEAKRMKMTPSIKQHFDALLTRNEQWFEQAEALGWRQPSKEDDEIYVKMVNEAKKNYAYINY